ncbi:MAG: alpha-amylase [Anaerolineaceae bacterium]|nr:alpha-amylase [Anaerolineaceae bacterium]
MEFHVSRQARDRYQFDQSLFSLTGNVIFANFPAVRLFAQKINARRDLSQSSGHTVQAGQLNAMGLIDEILHFVVTLYRRQKNPAIMLQAYAWLEEKVGKTALENTLEEFCAQFPPLAVYQQEIALEAYLNASTEGTPNRLVALEEMLLLWLANQNPAFHPFNELFDDTSLSADTAYPLVIAELDQFFKLQPPFGPDQDNLVDMLRKPAIVVPYSLPGQLEYIRKHWGDLLGEYFYRLLISLDLIREEEKSGFLGPGPVLVPTYGRHGKLEGDENETERFSEDREWMPRLVLIAKNSYVWLDQLSKKYNRLISRLDEIPDEELDQLAHWGITGLWLIGLWERSTASARIKQLCGNPEAIASAYSLAGYWIAQDLGGAQALDNLRSRAAHRGIRLASDMVPNHMGIDSPWVFEYPDRFISLSESPFPSYSFNGPDLSNREGYGIFLEDHYFTRSDAAVVFKWVNYSSSETRFIYHGNDGTTMPWNDTAQLDYLKHEVREAVLHTILEVARQFPIIRFDAAMTLTKRHFHRLWYPQPGSGGDIPSRSGHGLTKDQFDSLMNEEFWREVVDRAAVEAPDTLLLAEAFWLMEGYFVRTLGMHRVYNSAFMNLLRDEDNAKYRTILKNTLEFEPEILKRFVNFLNNPDERTAVEQFGKEDKYFGVCTLMVTLPGLPMFGHGQIEGYSEKYGMEYRKAYWDEQTDFNLVERHERQIFPLLHRRTMFAGVERFLLYDFYLESGVVNEDVYAYSNRDGSGQALVVYHNRFANTRGWIRTSAGFTVKSEGGRNLTQKTLAEGLGLSPEETTFVLFRDQVSGLQYIQPSQALAKNGLFLELNAYQCHVFLDFQEIMDDAKGSYRKICDSLAGRGVPSIESALQELILEPVLSPFKQIANPGYFHYLLENQLSAGNSRVSPALLEEAEGKIQSLMNGIIELVGPQNNQQAIVQDTALLLDLVLSLPMLDRRFPAPIGDAYAAAVTYITKPLKESKNSWLALFGLVFTQYLGKNLSSKDFARYSLRFLEEWRLAPELAQTFRQMGLSETENQKALAIIRLLLKNHQWLQKHAGKSPLAILQNWLGDKDIREFLSIHLYGDILWFNKEAYEEFLWWMGLSSILGSLGEGRVNISKLIENLLAATSIIKKLLEAEEVSGYQVSLLLKALGANQPPEYRAGLSSPERASDDD